MKHWFVTARGRRADFDLAGLCSLSETLGSTGFAQCMLAFIDADVPICQLGISRLDPDDTLKAMWYERTRDASDLRSGVRDYASRYYLSDPIGAFVDRLRADAIEAARERTVLVHEMRADEVPNRAWRRHNYEGSGLIERVSLAAALPGREIYGLSLFRHQRQGLLKEAQLRRICDMAPLLIELAIEHDRAQRGRPAPNLAPRFVEERLRGLCATLTQREIDVGARILRGMTFEGIALDLGIGSESVRTYRNRAFGKLGISSRDELFALFMG